MSRSVSTSPSAYDADVIVVGAGPAGSTTAYHLAQAGLDVLLLEKTAFPREKVCGDGLTPRAVKQLLAMGIDTEPGRRLDSQPRAAHHRRRHAPGAALARSRHLPRLRPGPHPRRTSTRFWRARRRRPAPGCSERTNVTGPVLDERTGRIIGVTADRRCRGTRATSRPTGRPLVVAADGNSTRLSLAMGLRKRDDRPMGVAVAPTTPARATTTTGSSRGWSCGTATASAGCSPATAGSSASATAPSTSGLGILNSSQGASARSTTGTCCGAGSTPTPEEWGFREENRTAPIRGAALPMGFNRTAPLHARPAAGRRRRRHGQPVQRRGHRLRHGVRRAGGRDHRAGPRSRRPPTRASGRCRPTRRR